MQGTIIRSPELLVFSNEIPSIFLAGGITGCPDWQSDVAMKLATELPVIVYNPRRIGDLAMNGEDAYRQIHWEHMALNAASMTFFWFPAEGQCMISLFELGKELGRNSDIVVGVHPGYVRRFDVETQIELEGSGIKIYNNLDFMVDDFIDEVKVIMG